jgi:hypothetical protein
VGTLAHELAPGAANAMVERERSRFPSCGSLASASLSLHAELGDELSQHPKSIGRIARRYRLGAGYPFESGPRL